MKKRTFNLIISLMLILTFFYFGCQNEPTEKAESKIEEEAGPSSVTLSSESIKTAGIQIAEARIQPVIRTFHASGEIVFNPKRQAHVTARTAGRIEQVSAYPGDRIQKEQILLTLYSQDFLSLQAELLQASERFKRLQSEPGEKTAAQSLLNSVRNRLKLLDVSDAELAEVEKTGLIIPFLPVRAPLTSSVIESSVKTGDYIELGASLFKIADLSTVWVEVHLFEKDLAGVRPGCEVIIRSGAFPDRGIKGRLFQIGSVVDEKSRTVEGWIELSNPEGNLRPGTYIEADIVSSSESKSLFIPSEAVQDWQTKKVVFVQAEGNTFSLREVEIGISLAGSVEILKGLTEKERVATSGSFFIKSELLKKDLEEV